jgi:anthranilate synthase component 1
LPVYHLPNAIDLLALHQAYPDSYPFFLEKSSTTTLTRYSILFAFPEDSLRVEYDGVENFTTEFDLWFAEEKQHSSIKTHLPFSGGWFVYLGYELGSQVEPTLELPIDAFHLPIAIATRVKSAIIYDHKLSEYWFVTEETDEKKWRQVEQDVASIILSSKTKPLPSVAIKLFEDLPESYLNDVERIAEYIKAGDVFQVNLSRAWHGKFHRDITAIDIYQYLRITNPAPFSALVHYADFSIISSSPERLVRVTNGIIEARPIAGTRPRSKNPVDDQNLLKELINHPKERAEHIMLIDLVRNDLGRVSTVGSVEVDELMVIESYEHVHHIVSNIKGILRADITPGDVINAVFPGGTITGCPKVRCMEIIAELEKIGRGSYTGSVGYINHSGDLDFNILIRTMVMKGKELSFRTGAGIVYDSIPNKEVEETRHKAKGLLKVFESC